MRLVEPAFFPSLLTPLVLSEWLIRHDKYTEMFQQTIAFWCPAKKRRIRGIM